MALLRLLLAAAAAVATGPPLNSSSSSSSSTRKFLLLNTSLLQNSSGVRWTMHPPVLAEQPAITPERPWEQWGVAAVQVIEWSPGDKRLYYKCRERLPGLNAKGEPKILSRLCLASSVDGKEWHRKSLGLVEHPPGSGNTNNNIVWPSSHPDGTPTSGFAPMSFFRDLSPSAAADEPFKVIGQFKAGGKAGGVAWATSDGLRFRPLHGAGPNATTDPIIGVNCSDTDDIGVGWVPQARRYAVFVRHDGPDAVGPGGPGTGAGRRVSVCLTDNLAGGWGNNAASNYSRSQPWCVGETEPCPLSARSCCEVVAQTDSQDPQNLVDIYNTAATVYEDHILLFPSFYFHSGTKSHGDPSQAPPWGFGTYLTI